MLGVTLTARGPLTAAVGARRGDASAQLVLPAVRLGCRCPMSLFMPMSVSATTTARSGAEDRWEAVIGIEVHCQVRTASKMFCACAVPSPDAEPNTHTCPVCLALPGTLPTINRRAVEHVLAAGAAIGATRPTTRWDRKNYFYPDLPKGYQISQYDLPLASHGLSLRHLGGAGHDRNRTRPPGGGHGQARPRGGPRRRAGRLVDFNRAGVPLMEIVTEPEIRTAEQARRYAEELRLLLRPSTSRTRRWRTARCGWRRTSRSASGGPSPSGSGPKSRT